MTDDFDVALRDRLDRMAAAVPVNAPASIDRVRVDRVRTGSTGRRLALGGLVPLVAIVLVGTVVAGLAGAGPFAPGRTTNPSGDAGGPAESTTRSGDFDLTIRSTKARYSSGERIEIEASLTYRGPGETTIRHAQGAPIAGTNVDRRGGPIGFGIVESVVGDLQVGPTWQDSCEASTLRTGVPLTIPFAKSGAWSGGDPRSEEYSQFLGDPVLRLHPGTWHVFALTEFSIGECSAEQIKLRVEISIEVSEGPDRTPSPTVPSAAATPADGGKLVSATTTSGPYSLHIEAPSNVYYESQPIDVRATFTYDGEPRTIRHAGNGPLGFGIVEPAYGMSLSPGWLLSCAQTGLVPGYQVEDGFQKSGGFSANDPDAELKRAFLQDPTLRLPPGTWHVYAVASFSEGECGADGPDLRAEIEIAVLPAPASTGQ